MLNRRDKVIVGDQRSCDVLKKGSITLTSEETNNTLKLRNVRIVKSIGKNIISIGTLMKDGGIMEGYEEVMTIDIKGTKLDFTKNEIDGLYYTRMKRIREGDEVQYCNEISTINESKDDDNWKVVEQSSKKK